MDAITLQNVSAMPAPTWYRLRMSDTEVEIPADLNLVHNIVVEAAPEMLGAEGAFNDAVDALSERVYSTPQDALELAGAATESLDDTAYSNYQISIAETEHAASVAEAFETGLGEAARAWLLDAAGETVVVCAAEGQDAGRATVRVNGVDGAANVAAIDVVAAAKSSVELVVAFDTPEEGSGVLGATVRVFAGAGARVRVETVHTPSDSWKVLDDEGYVLDDDARVEVDHTVLGGGQALVGLAGDLRGAKSDMDVQTHYLGHGENELDFNYILRHRGRNTTCELNANGVLSGESLKTLRGTIDLIKGCKGAVGHEVETVLIADERAHNRTVPVILCSEDDVQGNHGATIGHIRDEQMFYLSSRGLSPEAAEAMFARAQLERAVIQAPDATVRESVYRLGRNLLGDFEEVE